jgi:hypothetical protein
MFEKRKAAKAAAQLAATRQTLTSMINALEGQATVDTPLVLTPGERPLYRIDGAGLFETRRGPGEWAGRSSGVSVPAGLGMRVRVGQSHGHYVQGTEQPTIIDSGTVTITDRRVVFLGGKWTREWSFAKVLGIQHFTNSPWTAIQVSNRDKTSGFTYRSQSPGVVHAWLDLAINVYNNHQAELLNQLKQQLQAVAPPPPALIPTASTPVTPQLSTAPTEPPGPLPAPGWFPDPSGQNRLRWWNGTIWTESVSD